MTLEEMKQKVYSMIEEYSEDAENLTEDEDLAMKMNSVINQIQNELARFKKIDAYKQMEVTEGQMINLTDIDTNIYQLNIIRGVSYDPLGDRIWFNEDGIADVYYYKYPKQINADTEDDYRFELDRDALEIMPYGVAGDLLKSDVSSNYGTVYSNRYKELIQTLDPRKGMHSMYFDGGFDI
jgi:hypothetical protein